MGNGADAEIVARLEEQGRSPLDKKLLLTIPSPLGIDPDNNMEAAADVVDAIAIAAGGSGWLWAPSYVVIKIDRSSAHLWTCYSSDNKKPVSMSERDDAIYLFANRAASGHSATVVSSRAGISLRHLLAVLPPLTSVRDLQTIILQEKQMNGNPRE